MTSAEPQYVGRFAPTPSGPLHLGSLLTALVSYLEARQAGGRWLLRIDDLDAPRCRPEHADTIMHQLEAHGLCWDDTPRKQSAHVDEYEATFEVLRNHQRLYPCHCTRAELAATGLPGPDGDVYGGCCLRRGGFNEGPHAWRLRVDDGPAVTVIDRWLGLLSRDRRLDIGDFVVRRSDRQIGYQLACVVDDLATGVTHVIRGADLIGSSLRQVLLFETLEETAPAYGHLPLLTGEDGKKLSKQNHATPIATQHALHNLQQCLRLLGQIPCPATSVEALLDHATTTWNRDRVPRRKAIRLVPEDR